MKIYHIIFNSSHYYWKRNLYVSLAVALCAAVITGALIVGDSVRYSLEQTARYRLGTTDYSITAGETFFTQNLATKLNNDENIAASAVVKLQGSATSQGSKLRLNKVQFIGIDKNFNKASSSDYFDSIPAGEVIVSQNVALRLNLEVGNFLLLKIEKAGLMPKNTPFVSDENQYVSRRVKINKIADKEHLGRFGLLNSQTAPFNIFVPVDWLNKLMEMDARANLILINSEKRKEEIALKLQKSIRMKDLGLILKQHPQKNYWAISSDKVFIKDNVADKIREIFPDSRQVLTYFANSIKSKKNSSPYSFVSTLNNDYVREDEIVINSWLAEDLQAKVGDTLSMDYFSDGLLRELEEHSENFKVRRVIPIENQKGDEILIPEIPGLSDTEKCSEWETGIPIDLDAIRDKDERYWYDYGGTPKAFVNINLAARLWKNRFGTYTSIIINTKGKTYKSIEDKLLQSFDPAIAGFEIKSVKEEALFAAQNGTDFSQLFFGLSFFIIVSALLLVSLLFLFNLEQRSDQIGHFAAMGFSSSIIRNMILAEGFIVAVVGAFAGIFLAIGYNELVFAAMSRVWQDIVRTDVLETTIQAKTLAIGFVASIAVSLITLTISVNRLLKRNISHLQKKQIGVSGKKQQIIKWLFLSILSLALVILLYIQIKNENGLNPAMFFAAGGLLLIVSLLFVGIIFGKIATKQNMQISKYRLAWQNIISNRRRSLMVIILLSIGSFLIISTGANRKDLYSGQNKKSSGTGGFLFVAKSTLPVLKNLNHVLVRKEFGISSDIQICQFRKHLGDDASCLNLNRISKPQILGFDTKLLEGRFAFITKTDEFNESNPWQSLNNNADGIIPAIADQTVIKWSLGKKVGDTLVYKNEAGENIYLRLIAGLAGSVFQGNVLISEKHFIRNFPSSGGSNFFLIDGGSANRQQIEDEFRLAFRDLGWEMALATEKLAEFKSVENTYLSIFLILGALGLLLGTVGLAIVLARSIYERRREIAIYVSSGFSNMQIMQIMLNEYFLLLIIGSLSGLISALLAVLPGLLNQNTGISTGFLIFIIAGIILHGTIWIVIISFFQIKKMKITEVLRNE